ncbi:hypothetical protein GCM10009850_118980 [Nonomuraea monospora]|uniref:Tetratricopeptide repeat protein n=1 Tax=Nonomuraea monospora TaxID=568818 RepID=A0ABN3D3Z8_9ACTN
MTDDLIAELRSAELAFLRTGDVDRLDGAGALADRLPDRTPYAASTAVWLLLSRYDRTGEDAHLDAAIALTEASGILDGGSESHTKPRRELEAAGSFDGGSFDGAWEAVTGAVLLRRCARDGDVSDLDRAITLGAGRPSHAGTGPLWLEPGRRLLDLSRAHLERYRLNGDDDDLPCALAIARRAVRASREPLVLASCLGQLAACEQELYLARGPRRLLDQAARRYERALDLAGTSVMVRPMLLTEYGTALQDRFAEDDDLADADRAVALAREAVATGACPPDLACHLVNLGTALMTRYESTGEPGDLDLAVRHWDEAVAALPARAPYRPAFHDRLAYGLLARWETGHGAAADVDLAVGHARLAVRDGAARPVAAIYRNHLSEALHHRWALRRDPADLDEAVRVFADAVAESGPAGARAPELRANLAHTLLNRYEAAGDPADVEAALSFLRAAGEARSRAVVASAVARALALRYEAGGRPGDLAAGIAAARAGLGGADAPAAASRTSWLSRLIHLRYLRFGRRRDLDAAIRLMSAVVGVEDDDSSDEGAENGMNAAHLDSLAALLSERYERDGDRADQEAAVRLARRARGRSSGMAAGSGGNLAAALHDRFFVEGRWDELEEAAEHHRAAAAQELPGSPRLPTALNNLGIVLQDVYQYSDDTAADAMIDEAIETHQRAVRLCPAASPHRPAFLTTLAAALQLRYERDRDAADLGRVIALYEQALVAPAGGATDRRTALANLASALHLRATASGRRADHDRAVEVYRSALRGTRGRRPARAVLLGNYAQALAERHDRFGVTRRSEVLRAFQRAAAAGAGHTVVRLHTMTAFAEWATRAGLWPHAAGACHEAATARRALFGVQRDNTHKAAWLRWGEDVNAAEAFARVRCGTPGQAVAALDAGRALMLSEALETRALPGRLRAQGRHDLAARYERALARAHREAVAARHSMGVTP